MILLIIGEMFQRLIKTKKGRGCLPLYKTLG